MGIASINQYQPARDDKRPGGIRGVRPRRERKLSEKKSITSLAAASPPHDTHAPCHPASRLKGNNEAINAKKLSGIIACSKTRGCGIS